MQLQGPAFQPVYLVPKESSLSPLQNDFQAIATEQTSVNVKAVTGQVYGSSGSKAKTQYSSTVSEAMSRSVGSRVLTSSSLNALPYASPKLMYQFMVASRK